MNVKQFCKERDEICRALDIKRYEEFIIKNGAKIPERGWALPTVPLASMHKARLHINSFTKEEKEISKRWLIENNYIADIW
jgi:hypothetical protein